MFRTRRSASFAALALSALIAGCSSSAAVRIGGQEQHAIDDTAVHGQLNALTVDSDAGSVDVTTGSTTTVHRDIHYRYDKPSAVPAETSAGSLRLSTACDCTIDYRITVPAGAGVTVDTGAGSVTISGADTADIRSGTGPVTASHIPGAVHAFVGSGEVHLDGIGGPLIATTLSGALTGQNIGSPTVDLDSGAGDQQVVFTAAPKRIQASAAAGNIELTLPRHPYRVDAHSMTGTVSGNLANDPSAADTLSAHSATGDIILDTR